jgi:hypothetical protein
MQQVSHTLYSYANFLVGCESFVVPGWCAAALLPCSGDDEEVGVRPSILCSSHSASLVAVPLCSSDVRLQAVQCSVQMVANTSPVGRIPWDHI